MIDTISATVEVLGVTMLPGWRQLMGLAQVEVVLDGVAIVLQEGRASAVMQTTLRANGTGTNPP